MTWKVERLADGGYEIRDPSGKQYGRYPDADAAAAHHCFAVEELHRLHLENQNLRSVAEAVVQGFSEGGEFNVLGDLSTTEIRELAAGALSRV